MIAQGGVSMMLFAGVVFFRHFNRVSSFGAIVSSMEPGKKAPTWKELEESLQETPSLMKAFARPHFLRGPDGSMVGEDMRQNTMYFFRSLYDHKHAREAHRFPGPFDVGILSSAQPPL